MIAERVLARIVNIQVVGGRNGNDIVLGVPAGVQYFLGKVKAVDVYFVFEQVVVRAGLGRAVGATVEHALVERGRRAATVSGGRRRSCAIGQDERGRDPFGSELLTGSGLLARTLVHHLLLGVAVERLEKVVVRTAQDLIVISTPVALELVKNTVVLVQDAEFISEIIVHRVSLHRSTLHIQIPHFDVEIVACAEVATRVRELYVSYAAYDFGKEILCVGIFALLENFGLSVAQGRLAHIA